MKGLILKILPILASIAILSCSKKSPDTPMVMVPERLEINPASNSIKVGETATYNLKYYNTLGEEAPLPSGIVWSSSQSNVATISTVGVASALGGGQTEIIAKRNSMEAKALLTVVSNDNEIATITIEPGSKELILNDTTTLIAVARNINNQVISGKSFTWQGSNNTAVQLSASGAVKGLAWGTSDIRASAEGKVSSPVMVQVIRRGNFSGAGSRGTGKLKFENNILKLQTSSDFSVAGGPPDLRIYLGNNSGNVSGAIEIGTLNIRTGLQTWNIPSSVTIGQYRYAIIWCKQLGGLYGVADLGN
jgi:hypothetical protein